MCDRNTAIQYLITNRFGSKRELKAKIHEHYNTFALTGFLYEPPEAPDFGERAHSAAGLLQEWIATPKAYERAKILNLKANQKLSLPSSPQYRSPRGLTILSSILKLATFKRSK